jgi:hypothetical protein
MIISASRRTDIPAYYADWLFNRMGERFVFVKNPMNPNQISRVSLDPCDVDCIVFWSKNPGPMLSRLPLLADYSYYFQFTLNPYGRDIEANLPDKRAIIETFKQLSDSVGPHKVIWRYDPVLLNDTYTVQYHIEHFNLLARELKGYTKKVVFSFMDFYKKINTNIRALGIRDISVEEKNTIAKNFSRVARENSLLIDTCAEDIDLSRYNISRGRCIDGYLIANISGRDVPAKKDKNQRRECGCAASVDIGAYNSCLHGCRYCYANYSGPAAQKNMAAHDTSSPFMASAFTFPHEALIVP